MDSKQNPSASSNIHVSKLLAISLPTMERSELFEILRASWESKEISARDAARRIGVNHRIFLGWVKKNSSGEKPLIFCLNTDLFL